MKRILSRKLTIREMVLFLFMPAVLAAVLICGGVSYLLVSRQLRDNTFSNAVDIVSQLQMNLNYRLDDIYEKYEGFLRGSAMERLFAGSADVDQLQGELDALYASRNGRVQNSKVQNGKI